MEFLRAAAKKKCSDFEYTDYSKLNEYNNQQYKLKMDHQKNIQSREIAGNPFSATLRPIELGFALHNLSEKRYDILY